LDLQDLLDCREQQETVASQDCLGLLEQQGQRAPLDHKVRSEVLVNKGHRVSLVQPVRQVHRAFLVNQDYKVAAVSLDQLALQEHGARLVYLVTQEQQVSRV